MLTPSAIASGTTTPRCSRMTRWTSAPPCSWSATRRLLTDVAAADDRFQQAIVVGHFGRRDQVAEAAGLLEGLDELIDVLRAARFDGDLDGEIAILGEDRIY